MSWASLWNSAGGVVAACREMFIRESATDARIRFIRRQYSGKSVEFKWGMTPVTSRSSSGSDDLAQLRFDILETYAELAEELAIVILEHVANIRIVEILGVAVEETTLFGFSRSQVL